MYFWHQSRVSGIRQSKVGDIIHSDNLTVLDMNIDTHSVLYIVYVVKLLFTFHFVKLLYNVDYTAFILTPKVG